MPVVAACSHCSAKVKVKDEMVGKSVKCPKCTKPFKVAGEAQPTAAESIPAAVGASAKTKMTNSSPKTAVSKAPPPPPLPPEKKSKAAWETDEEEDEEEDEKPKGKTKKSKKDDDEDSAFNELLNATLLPDAVKTQVREELGLKEEGVWVGQPVPKIMMVRAIPKVFLAGFITCFLSIFAGAGLLAGLGLPPLIVVPILIALDVFACIGWAILIVFMDRKAALSTAYVVTTKRCIVFKGGWFMKPGVESFYPDLLVHMRRMSSWIFGGGAGDIVFRSVTTITTTHHARGGSSVSRSTVYYGFLGVASMDETEEIIRNALLRDDDDDEDDDDDRPRKKKKKKRRDDDEDDD